MSFIRKDETGFRFIMRSALDATGLASVTIRLKKPDLTIVNKIASQLSGTNPPNSAHTFLVTSEFDDVGIFSAQLRIDMGGGKLLIGDIERFSVGAVL